VKISIITINYNGSKETAKLLESLKDQTDPDFEIIVVDNASEEADFANLQNQLIHSFPLPTSQVVYPQVKVERNGQNLGFSGGNNVGIRQALKNGSNWVVLLNNDTWVERDFIERLRAKLSTLGSSIVGMPIEESHKNRTAYCGQVRWLKPVGFHVYDFEQARKMKNKHIVGGAMAIHKNIFGKIGFFDEKYFLYFEDVDYSVRASKNHFNLIVLDRPAIHHSPFTTTKKLGIPLLMRYHYRNALFFNFKNGPRYIRLLVWPWSWLIVIKQLIKIAIKKNVEESKAILFGITDFYKNKYGKIENRD